MLAFCFNIPYDKGTLWSKWSIWQLWFGLVNRRNHKTGCKYMTHLSYDKFNWCIYPSLVMLYSKNTVLFDENAVFRHIMLCCAVKVYLKYAALWSYSEDDGCRCLWHIITVLWGYILSCPRRQHYPWSLQWNLQMSCILCSTQYTAQHIIFYYLFIPQYSFKHITLHYISLVPCKMHCHLLRYTQMFQKIICLYPQGTSRSL